MQTEIQFLINLLLEHKLPEAVKNLCITRIGEVEASLNIPKPAGRSPTTQQGIIQGTDRSIDPPQPVSKESIAQTPAAAAALQARQNAINAAMSDKPLAGQTSPVKFHGTPK
jgi:hypothetical protein